MLGRRDFIKRLFHGSLALGVATWSFPRKLRAAPVFNDYKALVIVNLAGGNDGLNTFVPVGSDARTGYGLYSAIRTTLRVADQALTLPKDGSGRLALSGGSANPYYQNDSLEEAYLKGVYLHTLNGTTLPVGTNGLMPEVAELVDRGQVAIVANCGNLIEPATKSELTDKTKPKPPFLFAHNHQTKLAFNGEASDLKEMGWAGRLYDAWRTVNGETVYSMNISLGGVSHVLYGYETSPLLISSSGPPAFKSLRRDLHDGFMALDRPNDFYRLYNAMRQHAFAVQDQLVGDWNDRAPDFTGVIDAYGLPVFDKVDKATLGESSTGATDQGLISQLSAVARLAHIGKQLGIRRQIFFVKQKAYDTHSNQIRTHASRLRGLSLALGKFQRALEALGMENEVTSFTVSEFGRTTGNNGDGTDHAWGSHHMVIGGAVKGGLYGQLPDLTLGGDQDISRKGRIIPTTSFTQYYATLVKWFGADDTTLARVFPELNNFAPNTDLGFMRI